MVRIPLYQVDAFTSEPFRGNPAAVCLLEHEPDDAWMQAVASEMNLSETAFVRRLDEGWSLRWFTPTSEVDLCGHATLGAAFVLAERGDLASGGTVRFSTRSGWLTAALVQEGCIELDFPAEPARACEAPSTLEHALGVVPRYVGRNRFDLLVELADPATLRNLRPDFSSLEAIFARGVIVTSAPDSEEFDFLSRFFAPAVGVPEDPVTGSAHCCLGPYWSEKSAKTELVGYQASHRGGIVEVDCRGERVTLRGRGVVVMEGVLRS